MKKLYYGDNLQIRRAHFADLFFGEQDFRKKKADAPAKGCKQKGLFEE